MKKPSDFVVVLSEVNGRILFNILYNISNDIFKMPREYKGRDSAGRRELLLDYCVSFVRTFYFDNVCPLLKPTCFLRMYMDFEINYDYFGENLNIINDSYLQYCVKEIE